MRDVYLYNGYRSNARTKGVLYPKGIHTFDDELATYLVETGHGEYADVIIEEVEPEPERQVTISNAAQKLMDSFDLTIDHFPEVDNITKPIVDAYLANQMASDEEED